MTNKVHGRPWPKGVSGNPAGKPKGARHRVTILAEKLMAGDAEAIIKVVLSAATGGDMAAARMVLDRIVPPLKERPISLDLPDTGTAAGVEAAQAAILAAVAAGSILPGEAAALSALVEARRRAIETSDIAQRVAALEQRFPQ